MLCNTRHRGHYLLPASKHVARIHIRFVKGVGRCRRINVVSSHIDEHGRVYVFEMTHIRGYDLLCGIRHRHLNVNSSHLADVATCCEHGHVYALTLEITWGMTSCAEYVVSSHIAEGTFFVFYEPPLSHVT